MEFEQIGSALRVRAPAKVNLYLEILGKRDDGFHDLDSLFQAVSLYDVLEFGSDANVACGECALEVVGGGEMAGPPVEGNLVLRAAALMRDEALHSGARRVDDLDGLRVALRKGIPMGAGLGGGSSDAAATLLALDRLWGLRVTRARLQAMAETLGSDVPFFLHGGLARCQGRGERVTPLLGGAGSELAFVLASPELEVSTASIYRELASMRDAGTSGLTCDERLHNMSASSVLGGIPDGRILHNRLQDAAFRLFPELRRLGEFLLTESSLSTAPFSGVLMTGSGSTLFGLCESVPASEELCERLRSRLDGCKRGHDALPARLGRIRFEAVRALPAWDADVSPDGAGTV